SDALLEKYVADSHHLWAESQQPLARCVVGSVIGTHAGPGAVAVAKYGVDITGRSIMNCHNADSCQKIERVVEWFKKSRENNVVHTAHSNKTNSDLYMIALRDTDGNLLGYYEKYEPRNLEHTAPYAAMAEDRE
ncbi:MAG: PAS domain-containing protein, partial [Clostridia bacterium]|nr:PAS domain-containing protein [Clostridia bacterium]